MKTKNSDPAKIYILPKLQFHDILKRNNITDNNVDEFICHAFICVNDFKGGYYHEPLFISSHHNVLNLFFDDIEHELDISSNFSKTKCFSKDDAIKVIKFLNDKKDTKNLLIYCAAGISRSGAIGQFALSFLNGDKEHFKKENSNILPNTRVLKMLNKEIHKI